MKDARNGADWLPSGEQAAGGMVEFGGALARDGGKALVAGAPRLTRLVLRESPGLPGLVRRRRARRAAVGSIAGRRRAN